MANRRDPRFDILARVGFAAFLLAMVVCVGTVGYHEIGSDQWAWKDCLYMTMITLSTVGYGELDGMRDVPYARAWTIALIVFGSGSLVYFVSTITAVVVEGDLSSALRRNRMQRNIDALRDHVIVCGLGSTGRHVISELIAVRASFVVIENDKNRVEQIEEELGVELMHVLGDATHDHALELAGIARAAGCVVALQDDRDNLFVVISARMHSEKLNIVVKADDPDTAKKLTKAGANSVVLPSFIGGMRLASEVVRPTVVKFLDDMLRDRERHFRIEEIPIPRGSWLIGKRTGELDLKKHADALLLSIRTPLGRYAHNPGPSESIDDGSVLVVLARMEEVLKLRNVVALAEAPLGGTAQSG